MGITWEADKGEVVDRRPVPQSLSTGGERGQQEELEAS